MSHFVALVLTKTGTEEEIKELLEPYNENTRVEEYEKPCWCIGREAQNEASAHAAQVHGSYGDLRETFNRNELVRELNSESASLHDAAYGNSPDVSPEERKAARKKVQDIDSQIDALWKDHTQPHRDCEAATLAAHPKKESPDPDCDECNGTGVEKSTYNPKSKWDWWVVGGRWTGFLSGTDPEDRPENFEDCFLCNGTGKRDDELGREQRLKDPDYTCNGCKGKGKSLKWPTHWVKEGTHMRAGLVPEDKIPYAVVTPDGEWHQRGEMGWFGTSSNEQPRDLWETTVRNLLQANNDSVAVVVDLHI